MDLRPIELLEEVVSNTDLEVRKDLRESIDRVWAEAKRLGILWVDTPLRRQLHGLKPRRPPKRRHGARS